ncbi:MAG: diguanylate cyclase, partial [Firmicutes bacterium]|nr:diguanylate cyclase [Bacillota bacterium]
ETLATLAVEREKYLLTLLSIGDGVMVVDGKGRIEMLNGVGEKITGWAIEDAKGRHYKEVLVLSHESEGLTIADPIAGVLATDTVHELGNHAILTSKNGTKHHLEDSAAPIKGDNSETIGVVLVFRDVTEKKEQRKKIEYLSYHDSLTGLYNRGYFEAELHRLDTQRNLPISIIMGDVNGLKLTNDIFGHTYGDMLLQKVAQTIKNVCRADDIIARWGGDEFVILLPQTEIIVAEAMVLRIKDEFSKQQVKSIKGSISMGCAVKSTEEENIIQILELAEDKMYIEKTLVRNSTNSTLLENIINSLYEHYPHEGAHARRVSTLCGDIGKAMNLPAYEVKRLQEAGMLHDIGKISLGENLLTKNASLLEQEWKEIKQHPVVGYRILNGFDDTIDLAELVLTHHERLDGSGYPKGLRGEEIPKLARIIALAEGYDAMTNDSSYKAAMSKEDAIVEMQKKAGTQFDPSIVAIFVELLERS